MKKLIAFDLDETVTETRSPITDEMSELMGELLKHYQVCVISGGGFGQFEKQLLANLKVSPVDLERLHLMPTCGSRYYSYNLGKQEWQQVYAEELTAVERKTIMTAFEESLGELVGYQTKNPIGLLIEDRGTQITYAALGMDASPANKKAWDPSGEKKLKLRNHLAERIPQFEVRAAGTTSVDVTRSGIDKAYGMAKLVEILQLSKEDILFIGDRIWEGGNDYPVKLMGIDCVAVGGYEHTPWVVRGILAVS